MFAARRTSQWSLVALAMVCILPLYWPTLSFDLFGDDYFFLRPYRTEHLWSVLTGPWMGAEATPFYRPLAVFAYKAMVYVFGLNTRALHAIPLVTMVLLAWLTGVFVRRETGSQSAAATAVVITSVHPLSTVAVGPWISNQYQGWVTVLLLCTLIGWQNRRTDHWRTWSPLWLACILAALIKEPGLMLPLMVVAYHALRALWLRDLPPPPVGAVLSALGLFAVLNLWRLYALGGLGGYSDMPSSALRNLFKAPYFVFVQPTHPLSGLPWSVGFGVISVGLCCVALWSLWTRRDHPENRLILAGLVILCGAAIPTLNIISADRAVPHQLGGVLMLTGGLWTLARQLRRPAVIGTFAVASLATTVPLTQAAIQAFNPCEGRLLEDREILAFRVAPPEMLRWQAQQQQPCDPETQVPFYRSTHQITWGAREEGSPPGDVADAVRLYKWTSPNVRIFLDKRATAARIRIRHADASQAHPITIDVISNRRPALVITLTSPDWQEVAVLLHPTWNVWTRQMHRVELIASPSAMPGLEMRPLDLIYASGE